MACFSVLWPTLLVVGVVSCRTATGSSAGLKDEALAVSSNPDLVTIATLAQATPRAATAAGIPGDIVNMAMVSSAEELAHAFAAAGWSIPVPLSAASDVEIAVDVATNQPYPNAPISSLYLYGRIEDQAFELEVADSPRSRHHIRLWKASSSAANGTPIWLGAATFDTGVTISDDGGLHFTHAIAPLIDTERDYITSVLSTASQVTEKDSVLGIGNVTGLTNSDGYPITTDGQITVLYLASGTGSGSS